MRNSSRLWAAGCAARVITLPAGGLSVELATSAVWLMAMGISMFVADMAGAAEPDVVWPTDWVAFGPYTIND